MSLAHEVFSEAQAQWLASQPLELPAKAPIVLWQNSTRTIYVEDSFGPAIPYPPVVHNDFERNYGYVRLKGNLDLVESIPELQGWPEFAQFVRLVNDEQSPAESVGCEIAVFDIDDDSMVKHRVGAYLDIVFSDIVAAQDVNAYLQVAANIMATAADCECWWSAVEIGLQRLRYLQGAANPLGLMLRITGSGRTVDEARNGFGETLKRTSKAFVSIPT